MRRFYHSLADVLGAPIVQAAKAAVRPMSRQDRVLKSTRLEDMLYHELRAGDTGLEELEEACMERLPTFPALSRDVFQSVYSLNVRWNVEETLSPMAAQCNKFILEELMSSAEYPVLRSSCEGRQLPAYEAAKTFLSQIADDLDRLLERSGGTGKTMDTLEHLERKREREVDRLRQALDQLEQAGPEPGPELARQVISAANAAQSLERQVQAVRQMVRDSLRQERDTLAAAISQAGQAAAQAAEEVNAALYTWGTGPEDCSPKQRAADLELVARVRQNPTLMEIARYLGRWKELIAAKRRNGYAYGRGEKYTLELGGDLSRALASEFALLATPATAPLFLRKLQRRALKQYRRREPMWKGCGDIICMLDESASAEDQAPWCKAVALALLDIAMGGRRRFAMIHFSGRNNYKTDLFLPGQYDREDVLRAAEIFLGGGTDFATPLREALRLMDEEGFERADMVFVTDGQCALPGDFLETFQRRQKELGFQVTGILLDQEEGCFDFSLAPFCAEIYRTSQLAQEDIVRRLLNRRINSDVL